MDLKYSEMSKEIKKGDIIEVINIDSNKGFNGKIKIGNRYIADSDPFENGMIKIINPQNPAYDCLSSGQYILHKRYL